MSISFILKVIKMNQISHWIVFLAMNKVKGIDKMNNH